MKRSMHFITVVGLLGLMTLALTGAGTASAATLNWSATPADDDWSNGANWGGVAPGLLDTANFYLSNITTIDVGTGGPIMVGGINYQQANNSFTIGTGGAGAQTIIVDGVIKMNYNVASAPQTIDANVVLGDDGSDQTLIWNLNTVNALTVNGSVLGGSGGTVAGLKQLALETPQAASDGRTLNLNGVISDGGGSALQITMTDQRGRGDLALTNFGNANNTFGGGIGGFGGKMAVTAGNGTALGTGTVAIRGIKLDLGGSTQTVGRIDVSNAGIIQNGTLITTDTSNYSWGSGTINANIQGGGALTIAASGAGASNFVTTLGGDNSYTGATTINSGVVRITNSNAIPSGRSNLVINQGAVEMGADNMLRNLGPGPDDVQVPGGASGFSAYGGARYVTVNNDATQEIVWGGAGGDGHVYFNPSTLILNANTANSALTLSNKLDLNSASAARTIGVYANTATISNVIRNTAGAGGLTKVGNGTLVLSAADTYTGTTTIQGGTLQVGDSATGSLNGTTGTPLTFTGSGAFVTQQAASVNQGMGAVTFTAGEGTIKSTYAGTPGTDTTTLTLASLSARPAGAAANFVTSGGANGTDVKIAITSPPTAGQLIDRGFSFNGSSYAAYDAGGYVRAYGAGDANYKLDMVGAVSTDNVALSANVVGQATAQVNTLNMANYTMTIAASGVLSTNGLLSSGNAAATIAPVSGTAYVQPTAAGGELVARVDGASDVLTLNTNVIVQDNTSASSLTKTGAGKLTLTTKPTYTGATSVLGGTLQAPNVANALGNSSTVVFDGATLANSGQDIWVGQNTSNRSWTFKNSPATNFFGIKIGAAGFSGNSLTITGPGSQSAANFSNSSQLIVGQGSSNNTMTVSDGAFVRFQPNSGTTYCAIGDAATATNNTLRVTTGATLFLNGNQALRIGNNGGTGNALLVDAGGQFYQYGSNGIELNGSSNTMTVDGAGSYAGANDLWIGKNAGNSGNIVTISNGGRVFIRQLREDATAERSCVIGASDTSNNNALIVTGAGSQFDDWMHSVVIGATGVNPGTPSTVSTGNYLAVRDGGLVNIHTPLTLGGASSWFELGDGNALATAKVDGGVNLNYATSQLRVNNGQFQPNVPGTLVFGAGPVVLNGPFYVNSPFANSINSMIQNGTGGSVTKQGSGTLTLNAANTYTGATTVSGGTLKLSATGSINSSATITVAGGATYDVSSVVGYQLQPGQTLRGGGTVVGALTTLTGSGIAPGTPTVTGTLKMAGLATSGGETFSFRIGSTASDLIDLQGAGTLNAAGVTTLSLADNGITGAGTWDLIRNISGGSWTTGNFSAPASLSGYNVALNATATALQLVLSPAIVEWIGTGGGNWGDGTKWSGTIPDSNTATANFLAGGPLSGPAVVDLQSTNRTVQGVNFNNGSNKYTVASTGGGVLNLTAASGSATLTVTNAPTGGHEISANVALNSDTAIGVDSGKTLKLTGADVTGASANVTKTGGGTVVIAPASGTKATQIKALTITGGQVDLANGRLDITSKADIGAYGASGTGIAGLRAAIKNAYAAGRWTGLGLTSSTAAADYVAYGSSAKKGVGYLDNGIPASQGGSKTSWQGRTGLNSNHALVKFTYYGDTNLDGAVNLADFGILKANYGATNAHWYKGDFNYDNVVNLADFGRLKAAYGSTPITAGAAVPEPSVVALLLTSTLAIGIRTLRRRRA